MKTYTIYASQTIYFKKIVQADNEEQADILAFKYDANNEWEEYDYGEWLTEKIEEEQEYTCPKFEPAREEI